MNDKIVGICELNVLIVKRFAVLILTIGFILILYPFWPHILDILLPTNKSRSRSSLPLVTEYFVNQEKYFYPIMLHVIAALFIGLTAFETTGVVFLAFQHHACGMFRIAR